MTYRYSPYMHRMHTSGGACRTIEDGLFCTRYLRWTFWSLEATWSAVSHRAIMDTQVSKSDGVEETFNLAAQNGDCSNAKDDDDNDDDPLMKTIGDFGRWQLLLLTCHIYTNIYFIWQVLANKFLASQQPPDFVCVSGLEFSSGETVDQCFYTIPGDNLTVPCDKWEYSNSSIQVFTCLCRLYSHTVRMHHIFAMFLSTTLKKATLTSPGRNFSNSCSKYTFFATFLGCCLKR